MNIRAFIKAEINGFQLQLDAISEKCKPLPKCAENKRHKWNYKGDKKNDCKVCGLKYQRTKPFPELRVNEIRSRMRTLEAALKQEEAIA